MASHQPIYSGSQTTCAIQSVSTWRPAARLRQQLVHVVMVALDPVSRWPPQGRAIFGELVVACAYRELCLGLRSSAVPGSSLSRSLRTRHMVLNAALSSPPTVSLRIAFTTSMGVLARKRRSHLHYQSTWPTPPMPAWSEFRQAPPYRLRISRPRRTGSPLFSWARISC